MKPRKLSSGKWFIQVQANGVRRSFSAPARAEVMRKAMKYKAEPSEANTEPLGAVIDRYIEAKRNVLSPSTITSYEMIRRRNFEPRRAHFINESRRVKRFCGFLLYLRALQRFWESEGKD